MNKQELADLLNSDDEAAEKVGQALIKAFGLKKDREHKTKFCEISDRG